jgi:ribosome-associated toxin RatA of RatAB toxin-antitoxin module
VYKFVDDVEKVLSNFPVESKTKTLGRSIRANVGVEFKGVRWEFKGVEVGD